MTPLKPWLLSVVVLVAGLVGLAVNAFAQRSSLPTPVLPLSALASMGVIAAVTLVLGIRVLRWRNGHRTRMLDPIFAARTLVLGHACAYAGAVLLGWHAGVIADQVPFLASRADNPVVLQALGMMAGGVVMVAIGFVVERFCRIPPEDGDEAEGAAGRDVPGGRAPDTEGGLA
jgi:peptidoglycan biosynthesis protein MviN/MurJ (putative lipid II flippase)